jgi:glycosyltransferase involved in cell wall biosynthesis
VVTALLAAADCLVSLHRGEGLGLQLAAAMWLETPVVASRYSGNLDFMSDETAALVDVTSIAVERGEGAYPDGFRWADADVAQAAAWMERLVREPELRERMIAAAAQRMREQPSEEAFGQEYARALRDTSSPTD